MDAAGPLFQESVTWGDAGLPGSAKDIEESEKANHLLQEVFANAGDSSKPGLLDLEASAALLGKKVNGSAENQFLYSPMGVPCARPWDSAWEIVSFFGKRRSQMFRKSTALRTYDIGLEPSYAICRDMSYILIPVSTLYRKHSHYFRRLLTVSIAVIPVEEDRCTPRLIATDEIREILRGQRKLTINNRSGPRSLFEEGRTHLCEIAKLLLRPSRGGIDEDLPSEIVSEIDEACDPDTNGATLTVAALAAPISLSEIAGWNEGESKPAIDEITQQLMVRKNKSSLTVKDVRDRKISGDFQDGRDYVGVFDVESSFLFAVLPANDPNADEDALPNTLIWALLQASGLSSLREMLWVFYQEIASSPDRKRLSHLTTEFVDDFEQFYDLDWKNRYWQVGFGQLKEVDGIEARYAGLKDKLQALRDQLSTNATLDLTLAALTATVAALCLTMIPWAGWLSSEAWFSNTVAWKVGLLKAAIGIVGAALVFCLSLWLAQMLSLLIQKIGNRYTVSRR